MNILKTSFLVFFLTVISSLNSPLKAQTGKLDLEITNIAEVAGSVRIAVYAGEENFLESGKETLERSWAVVQEGPMKIQLEELPFGVFSVAVYHDLNNNDELDTNFMGIPNEPYGFSNDARSKWGPPKFSDARFELNQKHQKMVIQVKKWSKQ